MVTSRKSTLYFNADFRFQCNRNWNQCNADSWIATVMFENDFSKWGWNTTFMVLMSWPFWLIPSYIHFSIRPSQWSVIINLKYNRLEIWWRHQKNHVTLVTILLFLKDLVQNHIHAKFHTLGLTCSGFMMRGPLATPTVYLMSTNPNLVRVKLSQRLLNSCSCFTGGSECYKVITIYI